MTDDRARNPTPVNAAWLFFGCCLLLTAASVVMYLYFRATWAVLLVQYTPSLSGVLCALLTGGRAAMKSLAARCLAWKVNPLWYALILLFPAISVASAASTAPEEVTSAQLLAAILLAFAMKTFVGGGLGEELGWRGFLLPQLLRTHSFFQANLLVGFLWGVWHYPAVYVFQMPDVMYLVYPVACIALSFIMGWMYVSSQGSLLVCILFHAALNTPSKFNELLSELPWLWSR